MADVQDGLCSSFEVDSKFYQIDCGSKESGNIAYDKMKYVTLKSSREANFILSHFHYDHYNGLVSENATKDKVKFSIKDAYFPGIPKIVGLSSKERNDLLFSFLVLGAFYAYQKTGITNLDFVEMMKNVSRSSFCTTPLYENCVIKIDNNHTLKVLWPPYKLENKNLLKSIKKALLYFREALEKYPALRKISEELSKKKNYIDLDEVIEVNNKEFGSYDKKDSDYIPKQKGDSLIKKADKALKNVANRLSLAFEVAENEKKEILFMGDLEKFEINETMKKISIDYKNDRNDKYSVFIAPHHGTHWSKELSRLKVNKEEFSCITMISIGTNLIKNIKLKEHKAISGKTFSTICHEDIHVAWCTNNNLFYYLSVCRGFINNLHC